MAPYFELPLTWALMPYQLPQLDQGYLDENTTLVPLSIGGNDARFGDVIALCEARASCQDGVLPDETQPMSVTIPRIIRQDVRISIEAVLAQIHAKAPNAKIVLMGYPILISHSAGVGLPCAPLIDNSEIDWMKDMGDLLAGQMQLAVDHAVAAGFQQASRTRGQHSRARAPAEIRR
jgi:hypothetical protein